MASRINHFWFRGVIKGDGVYNPPRIYYFNFSAVNRTFETVFLLQKQYLTQTETPQQFSPLTPLL